MDETPADARPEQAAWRTDPEEDRADREAGAAFLDEFDHADDEGDQVPSARALILTSASVTLVAVLACIGFVGGALWASLHEPDLDYTNLVAEIAIKIGFALFVGVLTGAIVAALATAIAGGLLFWHRRQPSTPTLRAPEAASSTPPAASVAPGAGERPSRPARPAPSRRAAPTKSRRERSH